MDSIDKCPLCMMWREGGDMSPRIAICKNCGKRNAFIGTYIIIDDYAKANNLTYEEVFDIAHDFLKQKHSEYRSRGDIYFDEDYFNYDLRVYFKGLNLDKLREKSNEKKITDEKKIKIWWEKLLHIGQR